MIDVAAGQVEEREPTPGSRVTALRNRGRRLVEFALAIKAEKSNANVK